MRKPAFCICENKNADQLRGNREADQRLCFRYIESTTPLLSIYKISSLCLQLKIVDYNFLFFKYYYVPQPKGGTYCFWCGSRLRRRPRSFVSERYLLNRWMDFDQTCTDTLLGGRNKLIRFW